MLGVEYFIGDLDSATATVLERVRGGRGGYACLCGVHGIVTAQHSDALMARAQQKDESTASDPEASGHRAIVTFG